MKIIEGMVDGELKSYIPFCVILKGEALSFTKAKEEWLSDHPEYEVVEERLVLGNEPLLYLFYMDTDFWIRESKDWLEVHDCIHNSLKRKLHNRYYYDTRVIISPTHSHLLDYVSLI